MEIWPNQVEDEWEKFCKYLKLSVKKINILSKVAVKL